MTVVASYGPSLQPGEDKTPNREINQSLWTARIAMVAILSLPVIALLGSFERSARGLWLHFGFALCLERLLLLSAWFLEADSSCQGTSPSGAASPRLLWRI